MILFLVAFWCLVYWWRLGGDSCWVSAQVLAGEELGSLYFRLCKCILLVHRLC